MECRARDLHDFFNVALQTVDVRKVRKSVMKREIVLNTTFSSVQFSFIQLVQFIAFLLLLKRISKTFAYLIMKKLGLNKLLNFCLIVYYKSNRKAMNRNWINQKANPALKTKAANK